VETSVHKQQERTTFYEISRPSD